MKSATSCRNDSYQKRVPAGVVAKALGQQFPIEIPAVRSSDAFRAVVIIRPVIKFSLRTRDPAEFKRHRIAVAEQLERIFEGIQRGPVDLDHWTIMGLSGEVYRLYCEHYVKEPGLPEDWEAFKAYTWAAIHGHIPNPPSADWQNLMLDRHAALGDFGIAGGPELLDAIEKLPTQDNTQSLENRFGFLTSWVLGKYGLDVTRSSRLKLHRQIAEAALEAGLAMKQAALGDYTPDKNANRFPPITLEMTATRVDLATLFEQWRRETKPSPATLATWRPVVASLRSHIEDKSVARLTVRDITTWKDKLVAQGRSASNINGTYLACIHALLAHGVRNGLLSQNVASGIGVKQKRVAGTSMLPYEDAEVAALLTLAAKQEQPARRWLPLLAACSGARVGELAQLWAERVREVDGVFAMELRPAEDGGTFKNAGSERVVPLHPALVEAGFLKFVQDKKRGPLFYGRNTGQGERHASKGTVNHLADWIRKQSGFDNPRKAPSHALRHWWKSTASRVGISDSRADFIKGHKTQGEAARYRHFDLQTLAIDMARMPIPKI